MFAEKLADLTKKEQIFEGVILILRKCSKFKGMFLSMYSGSRHVPSVSFLLPNNKFTTCFVVVVVVVLSCFCFVFVCFSI